MRLFAICSMMLLIAGLPAAAQDLSGIQLRSVPPPSKSAELQAAKTESLSSLMRLEGLPVRGLVPKAEETCILATIDCNATVSSVLQTSDCALDDGTFVDFWEFDGVNGQAVTIDLMSEDFDTFLLLLDPTPEEVASDDDSGTGTNSRIADFTLDQSGEWTIAVNNFFELTGDPGDYTLTLTCTAGAGTVPAAPSNLTATAISSTEIELLWQDNSNNEDEFRVELRTGSGSFQDIGSVPANSIGAQVTSLLPSTTYDFRVRARNSAGDSPYSNEATATTEAGGPAEPCVPSDTNLCLNGGRFKVEVQWVDLQGGTGPGRVVPFGSDDSGLFWFFAEDNWEMLVKVINACDLPGYNNFWVFSAATTNVEYTLRVTDSDTGAVRQYTNPLGTAAPALTDTSAFATCP